MDSKLIKAAAVTAAVAALSVPGAVYGLLSMPKKEKKKHPDQKTMVCIGDSITFGAGVLAARKKEAWPYILNRLFEQDIEVLNYGINGAAMQRSADTPYSEDYYKAAEEIQPDIILLMLGTNDSKPQNWNAEEFEKDYEECLKRFMKEGREIVLLTPPKAFPKKGRDISAFDVRDSVISDGVIPVIRKLADQYGLRVIDLYTMSEDHPEYFKDGVHPNKLGNQIIANDIFRAFKGENA